MSQHLIVNIIPFKAPVQELQCALYTKKTEGFAPIHKNDLKGIIEKHIPEKDLVQIDWLYTDFKEPKEKAINITVDLTKSVHFASHYYRHLIRNYFDEVADLIRPTFINEIEVWFRNETETTEIYTVYNIFTLKLQYANITDLPELVLSFDGTSKILNQSLQELVGFPTDKFNWINCDGKLYRYRRMPSHYKQEQDKLFPVLSNPLKPEFEVAFDTPDFSNRYPKYLTELENFYNTYLNTDEFRAIIPLSAAGFLNIPNADVLRTKMASNDLLFNKGKHKSPAYGMRNLKPYKASPHNNIRFFFIYHKPERNRSVEKLYDYFTKGIKATTSKERVIDFPKLSDYISQPFSIDKQDSIAFESTDNIISEVENALKLKDFDDNYRYIALYISPIPKTEPDPAKHLVYFRIKEMLLQRRITSQVIYTDNILVEDFDYYLANIEIALLAKIDGIPWRLDGTRSDELIVGVGAFYSISKKTKYVGSAFCFANEGTFEGFTCFSADETMMLAGSIRKAVLNYIVDHEKADRLIIHFYKKISKKELQPVMNTLHKLGLQIPVIIVTINKTESKELLAFDKDSAGLIPLSGTMVQVGHRTYLLFNNTRYYDNSTPKPKEYHFPIKVSFSSSKPEILEDVAVIKELMDQVYQFSRMYWKSVSQQSLPVTIKYPEMVAEIYPFFQHEKLPEFGQKNLWFL
jgi:hypothetical protein